MYPLSTGMNAMRTLLFTLYTGFCLTGTAFAEQAAPPIARAAPLTIQQQFDAGTAALDAAEWTKALEVYSKLESQLMSGKPKERSLAIVRLRKGTALFRLRRTDESEASILAAMEKLPADDPSLREDRMKGFHVLGDIAERRYEYGEASTQFRRALALSESTYDKASALNRLIPIEVFLEPERALTDADTLLALIAKEAKVSGEWSGSAHNLRGQVLLNLGRTAEAAREFDTAIKFLGGLRYGKVDLRDTAARSNAAIAAMRLGDKDKALKYLSFAGAAMQSEQGFVLGVNMPPPECGGPNGPKPEDVAVVELQINDDGSVNYARPVFFSGKPSSALEFGRAVSRWSWSPEELKSVKPFFRFQTRIEMRCTTVFSRPGTPELLWPSVQKWIAASSVKSTPKLVPAFAGALSQVRTELAKRETEYGSNSPQLMPILFELQSNSLVELKEKRLASERMLSIARSASAPIPVQGYFELNAAYAIDGSLQLAGDKFERRIELALTSPSIAADPLTQGALSLSLFDAMSTTTRRSKGTALLKALATDKTRVPNDPVRVGALIRLATLEYEAGRVEQARAAFADSGLSAQQCSLVDARQRIKSGNITSSDYPVDAIQSGFSGWTVVEFDISADGSTLNQRPIISFPPFIFGDPTVKQIKQFRYEQAYRPDGGLGCGGQQQRVRYAAHPTG
jgi:tetratricopeptide (TPR) repeat protein